MPQPRTPDEYVPLGSRGSGVDLVLEADAGEQVRLWITADAFPRIVLDVPNSALLIGSGQAADWIGHYSGTGAPAFAAPQGSLYLRSDGSSASTRLYVNTGGSSWTPVTTAT